MHIGAGKELTLSQHWGYAVLWFLNLRRQRLACLESEAERLIGLTGDWACATARRMARDSNDFPSMRYWASVQTIIERKLGESIASGGMQPHMIYERPKDRGFDFEPAVE
jgi:hypothetical protein